MEQKSIVVLCVAFLVQAYAADIYHGALNPKTRSNWFLENVTPPEEMHTSFWINQAQADLGKRLAQHLHQNKAKNIIMFLGDGMSIPTLTAARILKGQRLGKTGEETKLTMDELPYAGLSRTYCTDAQTADSACTATAYLCGVKTKFSVIGLNAHANYNNCTDSADVNNHVESIATWAQRAGKGTGIVTTTTVTHASPGGTYAHVANRNWESDADMVEYGVDASEGCVDIATQLITQEPGRNFDVILGGGLGKFLPNDVEGAFGVPGERLDGVNLIEEWKANNPDSEFVTTRDQLLNIKYEETDRLLGLFHTTHLEFNMDAASANPTQPQLKEMTAAAIQLLNKNENGYFLFVEGGRIDHGHHNTQAGLALDEMLQFDEAIAQALQMTNEEDTLIVVTADHAHTMSIAGYPGRGNPILDINKSGLDLDGIPYATINYAVGIKQYMDEDGKRMDLTGNLNERSFTPSYIRAEEGTHGGDDVAVLANGPHAHLFSGVLQQNDIPHRMAFAACIGNGLKYCQEEN